MVDHYIVAKPFNAGLPLGYVVPGVNMNDPHLLPCDGRMLSVYSYPELFGVIGTAYGGSGTGFNLPDLRQASYDSLKYEEFWETWPCAHCGRIFSDGHDRSSWWCPSGKYLYNSYYPMGNLEYLELKENNNVR